MSKNPKLKFKINCSPHLKMSEITRRLFNRNFHADVQFSIEGKIIYAHSLELIKRSVVFEQQLEDTMGETKFILINDCKYESFHEFMRYVYTDQCALNDENFIDILKLANKYKFIKLENRVANYHSGTLEWSLKYFDHCIREKYEAPRAMLVDVLSNSFAVVSKLSQFVSLHPDTVDELLKLDRVDENVSELQIFTALAEWITSYCKIHKMTLSEGRQQWDKLIRKIRFPIMSAEELRECTSKYPGLLNDNDRSSIGMQTVFGVITSDNNWLSKGRDKFIWPYENRKFQQSVEFETIFSVSAHTILNGLQIGIEKQKKPIEIEISETCDITRASQNVMFIQNVPDYWGWQLIICTGDSIRLYPQFKYTIKIKYLEIDGNLNVRCRKKISDVIINDPDKTVNLIQASDNILEMFFKPVTD